MSGTSLVVVADDTFDDVINQVVKSIEKTDNWITKLSIHCKQLSISDEAQFLRDKRAISAVEVALFSGYERRVFENKGPFNSKKVFEIL
jgi:hypothetical protein